MPSIIDGLFAGRAGIQSHGTSIAVLADNIANVSTTGFKQSRADFADLLAGNLGAGGGIATGSGSSVISVTPILTQGSFEFTGRGLDVGIDGNGYFVVRDTAGSGQVLYSRAGNFSIDTQGNLLNQNGYQVLGFSSTGAGGLQALNVNQRSQGSISTNQVTIGGNLDLSAPILPGGAADIPVAGSTYQQLSAAAGFSTFVDVFDSLGGKHTMSVYFFHIAPNTWVANAYVDGGEVTVGTAGIPTQVGGSATLSFGTDGTFTSLNPDINAAPNWRNGAAAGAYGISFSPFTQFSAPSSIQNLSQDGTGSGNVIGFQIEPDGTIFAQLDNGQSASIGVIALANFANPEALTRRGGSLFSQSLASGEPVIGTPGTGTFGSLEAGALELSNGDIGSDFIKLISLQRGFQGSARVISNINDLLNEIINLA